LRRLWVWALGVKRGPPSHWPLRARAFLVGRPREDALLLSLLLALPAGDDPRSRGTLLNMSFIKQE
jgi:hypothetical protein